jgi:protein PhnA
MSEEIKCPKCDSPYGYSTGGPLMTCPDCNHEWNPEEVQEESAEQGAVVKDSLGQTLVTGDDVIVIKNLPVKGMPKPVKSGTKVKNIRIVEGDHNIDCKISGFGSMALKSEFVKKA